MGAVWVEHLAGIVIPNW